MSITAYDPIGIDPAPAPVPGRRNVLLVGSLLAAAAGTVLIGAVLGDYLHARDVARADNVPFVPEGTTIPNVALFVAFIGLTLSSCFAQWTLSALRMDDRRQAYMATGFTVAMGLLFVNAMTFAWGRLALVAGETPYANHMYAVTVTHTVLVIMAIALWVVVGFRVFAGQFDARNTEPVVAAIVFWHFVVAAGLVVWWTLWFIEGGPG